MNKFYITFGSGGSHPFVGGWVEIMAENEFEARRAFNYCFPPVEGFGRFCGCYNEQQMASTSMLKEGNFGQFCRATITADGKNITYTEV